MNDMPKLLFINPGQYGYVAGYPYYVKYLKDDFRIAYVCHDRGLKKVVEPDISIRYVPFNGHKIIRYWRWLKSVYQSIKRTDDNAIIFMVYFKMCFVFGLLFPRKRIILDIRTGSLKTNPVWNKWQNKQFLFESFFFKHINILSEGLRDYLRIKPSKCHWLPLGADIISTKNKRFDTLKVLYVGTLNGRRIDDTIKGLRMFLEEYDVPEKFVTYDIFGFGTEQEELRLKQEIVNSNLQHVVQFHGRKNHRELTAYFDACNVGVSYIPVTRYYQFQPPTKTFEYILSGMCCLATDTFENRQLINDDNGVLIKDSPEGFAAGLLAAWENRAHWNSGKIRKSLSTYRWENIVKKNLEPYLKNIWHD
jgi:hypothetical protein